MVCFFIVFVYDGKVILVFISFVLYWGCGDVELMKIWFLFLVGFSLVGDSVSK